MGIRNNIARLFAPAVLALQSDWAWEVLASFMGIITIVSTVITLFSLKDHQLPQWPLKITPNTVLSLYAIVFKGSVSFVLQSCLGQLQWTWLKSHPRPLTDVSLYSAAGQGPWGSVMWLYTFHVRYPLATLAALVSVVSIATDPAFQQIIRFSDCTHQLISPSQDIRDADSTRATMPRTNYIDGNQLYRESGQPGFSSWSLAAQSAINAGVFAPVKPLTGNCPTGNCTFDIFHTAGYCSACHDVSNDLQFEFHCGRSHSGPEELWVPEECNSTNIKSIDTAIISYIPNVNGTTSSMLWNASYSAAQFNVLSGEVPSHNYYQPSPFQIIMGKTYFSENGLDPLTGKPMDSKICSKPSADIEWRCRGYGATSCTMYPCVRSYNVSVQNGIVSQFETHHTTLDLLGTFSYWNPSPKDYNKQTQDFVIVDVSCLSPAETSELQTRGYRVDTDNGWLAYNLTEPLGLSTPVSPDAPFPTSLFDPERGCAYVFDSSIDYQLWEFYSRSRFMFGTVEGSLSSSRDGYRMEAFSGSRELQALYNATNISLRGIQEIFDNIADSFTAYIRTNAGHPNYSIPATGTAFHYAVCLQVNWAWIALPSTLAVGILILLPLIILLSGKKGVPIWKSSTLPLVFRGPLVNEDETTTSGEQEQDYRSSQQGLSGSQPSINTTDGTIPLLNLGSSSPAPTENNPIPPRAADSIVAMEKDARRTMVQLGESPQGKTRLVLSDSSKDS